MNPDTAQSILDYIDAHPSQHDQAMWISANLWSPVYLTEDNLCQTTMCIAGTAVFLEDGIPGLKHHMAYGGWVDRASDILDLSPSQADALFYTMDNGLAVEALHALAADDEQDFNDLLGLNRLDDLVED